MWDVMTRYWTVTLWLMLLGAHPLCASDWIKHAERLTGESDAVHERSIRRLKRIPGLEGELTVALTGPNRFLAVDVIATLRLKPLLPLLIDLSLIDDTGTTYLAMNALMDKDNAPTLTELYRDRLLGERPVSLVAKMVILDTFGRIGFQLSEAELTRLYQEGEYEMKSAVVSYARLRLRAGQAKAMHAGFVRKALQNPYKQLRLQALHLLKDLPEGLLTEWKDDLQACLADRQEEVRTLCEALIKSLD